MLTDFISPSHVRSCLSRREMLKRFACGFGSVAFSALYGTQKAWAGATKPNPLLPRSPHFKPRARSVIFLYMDGGVSQVDSFDYKPLLEKHHGEDPYKAMGRLEKTQFANVGKVLKSPWKFAQHGRSGLWVSELFPHVAKQADRLCVVKSLTSKFPEHTSANYFLHSGTGLQGRPSIGAWATYGLGSENQDVPGFVLLNGGLIPSGGMDNFNSGFLPATYQASVLEAKDPPLANIRPSEKNPRMQGVKMSLIRELDQQTLERAGQLDSLESAIANHELAARMQLTVPELLDLKGESDETKRLYGFESTFGPTRIYAKQCLTARRMVERGVRFIELTCPRVNGADRWDAHGGLIQNHGDNARATDQPIAALLQDLQERGLLEDTLVVWSGEFGRTPFAQGSDGRDHNEFGFTVWMAGAGVKPGFTFGETDDWGYKAVVDKLEMHDLHATILHILGLDHLQLTYHFSGRDIRLTDVSGEVVHQILG
ncbi:MAG: DUF1501 domain-containing protein [Verrucomicrobiales bacterium]|nr:DUF1501 domain-containing protein [Verrucomicrobiales bacterium]